MLQPFQYISMKCNPKFPVIALIVFWLLFTSPSPLLFASPTQLVDNGSFLVVTEDNTKIQHNANIPYIPASTIKILTSLVALDTLGPSYRFKTHFLIDVHNNLYIQGGGDPFLTSENIVLIAIKLRQLGITSINNIILDDSLFDINKVVNGSKNSYNPYDVANSALAVNFNSLPIMVRKDGSVSSSEKQTPTLPIIMKIGKTLPPGKHRVNVAAYPSSGALSNSLRYVGELFTSFFKQHGISVNGVMHNSKTPPGAHNIFTYESNKTLKDMVRSCLKYSNNFIANQIFLITGIETFGAPATWEKGQQVVTQYTSQELLLDNKSPKIIEGSGLSRNNRITSAQMLHILIRFSKYSDLLQHRNDVYIKSGTLTGVYCYAGYMVAPSGLFPFVILLNQESNNRDLLLKELKETFKSHLNSSL